MAITRRADSNTCTPRPVSVVNPSMGANRPRSPRARTWCGAKSGSPSVPTSSDAGMTDGASNRARSSMRSLTRITGTPVAWPLVCLRGGWRGSDAARRPAATRQPVSEPPRRSGLPPRRRTSLEYRVPTDVYPLSTWRKKFFIRSERLVDRSRYDVDEPSLFDRPSRKHTGRVRDH